MKPSIKHLLFCLIACLPAIYLAAIWDTVPATITTHIGLHGPDAFGDKWKLWIPTGILCVVSIGVYFLLQYIHKIDPKRASQPLSPTFNKLAIGIVIFIAAINFLAILMTAKNMKLEKALFPLIGLLFAFLGNVMYSLKPNYFAGVRLPWTLHSDYNWRKTHQLTGRLWLIGGLLLTAVTLFIPMNVTAMILPVFLAIIVVTPIVYSFILFKREQADPNIANDTN